jgi:selenocysteine lyase/cysteine desulfurase
LRGPRGAGFLYVRRDLLEQLELPSRDSHTAEWGSRFWPDIQAGVRRFEYWHTHFTSKRIGLGAAIDYALGRGLDCTWTRISSLAGTLRNRLSRIPRVSVRDLGQHNSGIVTFTLGTRESQEVRRQLAKQQINVSDAMDDRGLARVVRASVHYYNTEEEIDRFCNAVSAF